MAEAGELQEAIAGKEDKTSLGYVTGFHSDGPLPDDLLNKHEGLQAIQSVRLEAGHNVHVAFWNSRDHFALAEADLLANTRGQAVFQGLGAPLIARKTPLYNRVKPATWLLSAVALLGALDALSHRYEQLFTAPNAVVRFSQRQFDMAQDEKLSGTITVENLLGTADLRNVHVALSVEPPTPHALLSLADNAKPSILAMKERAFAFDMERLPPGDYVLKATVSANGGYLRWSDAPFEHSTRVRVFPLYPKGHLLASGSGLSTAAVAIVPTAVALNTTAVCEVSFPPGPRFQFEPTYTADSATWESRTGDDDLMRAVLRWKPGPNRAKTDVRRSFRFAASEPLDWAKVAASATVACSQEKEGL